MEINKVLDLAAKGNKGKLLKYLNKGIVGKKDKIEAVKKIPIEGEGSAVAEDDILYFFSGTGADKSVALNLTNKEVLASDDTVVVTFDDIIKIHLGKIGYICGMSMLSTLPFVVERLDENIVMNTIKRQSIVGQYTRCAPIANWLGATSSPNFENDPEGGYLLSNGGLFRLTTGAGKVYEIEISQ